MKIILMMAQTIDGKIGKTKDHLANWTSKEDKKKFIEITKKAGVIIMGNNTYKTINRPLPNRLNLILTSNVEDKEMQENLEYFNGTPNEVIKYLENKGYNEAILCGGSSVNKQFLENNVIDEIYLTIEPKIFGTGLNLFKDLDVNIDLELLNFEKFSNSILLHYKVIK